MPYKDPRKQIEYQIKWLAARRLEFFKDKECVVCGSTEKLELDHIDEKQKVSHRIWSWTLARRLDELAKCQVLCEKCHQEKTTKYHKLLFTKPLVHGTYNAYRHKGCRCEKCKRAYSPLRIEQYLRTGN